VEQRRPACLDGLAHARDLVAAEAVRHHGVAGREDRGEELLDPGQEGRAVDRAVRRHRRDQPLGAQVPQERRGAPAPVRHRAHQAGAAPGSPARARVMVEVARVPSGNTSLPGSSRGGAAIQARHASATSARSRSAARGRFLEQQTQPVQHLPQAVLSVWGCCAMDGGQTVFCNGFWIRLVRHAHGIEAWHVDGTAVDGGSNVSFASFAEAACHAGGLRLGPYTLEWALQPLRRP
jgi:hypothetical protein